jgi:rhodanese-related sulfurtransferase
MSDFKRVTPGELNQRLGAGNGVHLVDVRNFDEYETVHVQGAECVPLPQLMNRASQWDPADPIFVVCQQGPRSQSAATQLVGAGFQNVSMVEGGTKRCVSDGLPVVRGRRRLPVQRQTFIVIGCMILTGLIGQIWLKPLIALTWLAGLGLIMAGVTGFCGMAVLIAKAPWNQTKPGEGAGGPSGAACSSGTQSCS